MDIIESSLVDSILQFYPLLIFVFSSVRLLSLSSSLPSALGRRGRFVFSYFGNGLHILFGFTLFI
jgi:hypothetical protein